MSSVDTKPLTVKPSLLMFNLTITKTLTLSLISANARRMLYLGPIQMLQIMLEDIIYGILFVRIVKSMLLHILILPIKVTWAGSEDAALFYARERIIIS